MITVSELYEKYPNMYGRTALLSDEAWNRLDEALFNSDWKTVDEICRSEK